MSQLNEADKQALTQHLGVYGHWLIKHARSIPQDAPSVQKLMLAYELYHRHPDWPTAGIVMGAIDVVCRELGLPKPEQSLAACR